MNTFTYAFFAVYAVLFVLRNTLGAFWSIIATVAAVLLHLKLGIDPPLPASVYQLFAAFVVVAAALYIVSSNHIMTAFWAPIKETIVNPKRMPVLVLALIGIPGLVGWNTYKSALPDTSPPARFRVVHPAPPGTVSSHGETFSTVSAVNPLRKLKTSDPDEWAKHVFEGRRVYYVNCYFCHGDRLAADGHIADQIYPRPISFRDTTTIPMFTEVFLFWRIAKGGPGLPAAATPWDSAMPAWDDFLTNEEMWQVIAYLYERTGYVPRAQKKAAAEEK